MTIEIGKTYYSARSDRVYTVISVDNGIAKCLHEDGYTYSIPVEDLTDVDE